MSGREIKFRVWYGEYGQGMVAVKSVSFDSQIEPLTGMTRKPYIEGKFTDKGQEWTCTIVDKPLMQYTGLKDSNGKEIYEGDIIKESYDKDGKDGRIWVVVSINGGLSVIRDMYYGQSHNELIAHPTNEAQTAAWLRENEIIGNIYENPELL